MGFWHTGYIEFHEPAGLDESFSIPPLRYCCQYCDQVFETADGLRRHRFEQHPYERPMLLFGITELGTSRFYVTRPIKPSDFMAGRCTSAVVNGQKVPPNTLGAELAKITNDRVQVILDNDGITATYDVTFAVPSDHDLRGVERCFIELARGRHLDRRAIESFIDAVKPFGTASQYYDGICQYLYGVLAKERASDSGLPYEDYKEKFIQAVQELATYERRLAYVIRALVAFHFNHFEDVLALVPHGRLSAASERFAASLRGDTANEAEPRSDVGSSDIEDLLTDIESLRILRWSLASQDMLKVSIDDIVALAQQDIPEYDRTKLTILAAEYFAAAGERQKARRMGRELINKPATAVWAEQLLGRLSAVEHP